MTDPRPAPYPSQPVAAGRSGLSAAALWAAIAVAVVGVVTQLVSQFLPLAGEVDVQAVGLMFSAFSAVSGTLGLVALVLGLIAARRPGDRHVFAGIAIGVGGLALLSTLVGFTASLVSFAL